MMMSIVQAMKYCNSGVASTRAEATALLFLIMKANFQYFNQHGFVRANLQVFAFMELKYCV